MQVVYLNSNSSLNDWRWNNTYQFAKEESASLHIARRILTGQLREALGYGEGHRDALESVRVGTQRHIAVCVSEMGGGLGGAIHRWRWHSVTQPKAKKR